MAKKGGAAKVGDRTAPKNAQKRLDILICG